MKKNINGLNIETWGRPGSRAIIFVHGFPFDRNLWEEQVKALKNKYYCVAYDVRGLGGSEVDDGQFTMEKFADDLAMIVSDLNLVKPVICGMSMGGYICLRAVEKYSEHIGGLILIDTKSEADSDQIKLKRSEAMENININGPAAFVENFIPPLFAGFTLKQNPSLPKKIIRRAKKASAAGIKGSLIAMLSRTDTTGNLKKIKMPVLVICGEEDKLTTPEVMKSMAGKIKNHKFVLIKKAGHMAPVENPKEVNKVILTYLKSLI